MRGGVEGGRLVETLSVCRCTDASASACYSLWGTSCCCLVNECECECECVCVCVRGEGSVCLSLLVFVCVCDCVCGS